MATPIHTDSPAGPRQALPPERAAAIALDAVAEAISRLRYGAIELTVHDGRVVQLEITERQRFA
ncbi:MAG: YezD family protein [Pseudomonadota bacterium]